MKKLIGWGMAAIVGIAVSAIATPALADGCFMCEGGGYVKYTGDDTFDKRKKAEKEFGCKVTGTTGSCSNPKGTVSLNGSQEQTPVKKDNVAKK